MNVHDNARLTPRGREAMVRAVLNDGLTQAAAAHAFNTTPKTVSKWVGRFRQGGADTLRDRSSRPHASPSQTPIAVCEQVEALRRERRTQAAIAAELGLAPATVSRILARRGLSRLSAIEPALRGLATSDKARERSSISTSRSSAASMPSAIASQVTDAARPTSEATAPQPGWEFVHVAIDDHSRVAFSQIKPSEKKRNAVEHLIAAVAYYRRPSIKVQCVMTDNGPCYQSKLWADTCRKLGIKHIRTRPYTPQTNGKAERFIQTALREWAYATAFETSEQRKAELQRWLHRYNWHRPHASLGQLPPISRLGLTWNNLLRHHT